MSKKVTYGFEFEISNMSTEDIADAVDKHTELRVLDIGYTHNECEVWKSVQDGSCGSELVSKVLTRDIFTEINTALKAVKLEGAKINRNCGLHVHIGGNYDNGDVFIQNMDLLYINWYAMHSALNGLVSPSRINNRYTESLTESEVRDRVNNYGLTSWIADHHWRDTERYVSLNILPMAKYPTVEFRLHQGTLNPAKAIAWASLCEAFIHLSNSGVDLSTGILPIRLFKGRVKDATSKDEAKILINYLMDNGHLSTAAGNYLLTYKI